VIDMVSNSDRRRSLGYLILSDVDHLPRQKAKVGEGRETREKRLDKFRKCVCRVLLGQRTDGKYWSVCRKLKKRQVQQKVSIQSRDDVDAGAS
jgi:hypothetical protein